jgi:SAM-dependent methyltransferase
MAITEIEYVLFRNLRDQGLMPLGGEVLELGEANWYGDVGVDTLREDIGRYAEEAARPGLNAALDTILAAKRPSIRFEIAKIYWATFVQAASLTAIDFHGSATALKLDLNGPVDLGRTFDIVMNLGTIEHVFNVAAAMKTVHDHVRPGGLMMHGMPLNGWLDHGSYSFNPTFYWDLAAANGYEIVQAIYAEHNPTKLIRLEDRETLIRLARQGPLGNDSLIYVTLRRPDEARPFQVPLQGYYAGTLTEEAKAAWRELR